MDNGYQNVPLGFAMALMRNESAKKGFEGLSETEKEHLILKCKDAKSKAEMDKIIGSIASADGLRDLFKGPSIG